MTQVADLLAKSEFAVTVLTVRKTNGDFHNLLASRFDQWLEADLVSYGVKLFRSFQYVASANGLSQSITLTVTRNGQPIQITFRM